MLGEIFSEKVNGRHKALITCYLKRPREVELPVRAEGSAEHGAEPTEEALVRMKNLLGLWRSKKQRKGSAEWLCCMKGHPRRRRKHQWRVVVKQMVAAAVGPSSLTHQPRILTPHLFH